MKMSHAERLKLLTEWCKKGIELDKAAKDLIKCMGISDIDYCPILKSSYDIFNYYTASVAVQVEDTSGWLVWYDTGAHFGTAKNCEAGAGSWAGRMKDIRTVEDLCGLIEADLV
jgi:hypothetical protein